MHNTKIRNTPHNISYELNYNPCTSTSTYSDCIIYVSPRLPPLFPRLASAASTGASAPCDCRARFRAAFRWLFLWTPAAQIASGFDRFRGCSALTASTVSRPSMLGRRLGARRRAARCVASEEQESEKRREGKEGASPSSPSWMARRDGPWRV